MDIAKNKTIEQWTEELSSSSPTPGGGGVGSFLGVLSSCLASMVANLTVNKEEYKEFSADCSEIILKSEELKLQLFSLIDEDAHAFKNLLKAYKEGAKDEDYAEAAKPSVHTVYALVSILDILEILEAKGNKNLISDVGAGASCVKASLEICKLNILINLKYIKEPGNKIVFASILDELISESIKKADIIYKQIAKTLK
jgi:formiminotetrahydrofolate cyclodeaminase